MAKVQFLRDDNITDPKALRLRLNQVIEIVNQDNPRHTVVRLASVLPGQAVQIAKPGFQVGAILLGGVRRVDGGALSSTAVPWISWLPVGDGTISVTINGLTTTNPPQPPRYEVILVVMEAATGT